MTGLLLINLGTPDAPTPSAVRRYLRQFLSDPRVLDINPLGRAVLLHGVILPFRPAKSAEAYRKIWTDRGSPLLFHSRDLVERVQTLLGPRWAVELGMRYGEPSLEHALARLAERGAQRVVIFPLYPQYSSASTGSSVEEVFRLASGRWVTPNLSVVEPFYDHPAFLRAFAAVGAPILAEQRPDHVVFSFHGLPERHILKADETGAHCLRSPDCSATLGTANRNCYRAQSYATARGLAVALGLEPREGAWTVAFQSRLGRTPWIRPYTDVVLPELAKTGVKRVVVFCPAFVADCLETLEEIGLRANDDFRAAGGESLTLVPSLNASPIWADAVGTIVRDQALRYGPESVCLPSHERPSDSASTPSSAPST
jgi:ferrochelatase